MFGGDGSVSPGTVNSEIKELYLKSLLITMKGTEISTIHVQQDINLKITIVLNSRY
jgi:hypothetical protein